MKNLLIKLGLWEEKHPLEAHYSEQYKYNFQNSPNKVEVDEGWYQVAMKHYCRVCEQWFKTASIASHNRFKHKNETGI